MANYQVKYYDLSIVLYLVECYTSIQRSLNLFQRERKKNAFNPKPWRFQPLPAPPPSPSFCNFHSLTKSSKFSLLSKLHTTFSLFFLFFLPFLLQPTSFPTTILTSPSKTTIFGLWRIHSNTHLAPFSSSKKEEPSSSFQLSKHFQSFLW